MLSASLARGPRRSECGVSPAPFTAVWWEFKPCSGRIHGDPWRGLPCRSSWRERVFSSLISFVLFCCTPFVPDLSTPAVLCQLAKKINPISFFKFLLGRVPLGRSCERITNCCLGGEPSHLFMAPDLKVILYLFSGRRSTSCLLPVLCVLMFSCVNLLKSATVAVREIDTYTVDESSHFTPNWVFTLHIISSCP